MSPASAIRQVPRNKTGHCRLHVEVVAGQSAVTTAWASNPLKLLTPRPRGRSVWAYLGNFGGGLVGGDQTKLDLSLGVDARCFLGTQASSKIYRNPHQRPCSHHTHATLERGSLLVFAPDPVQAFAGSRYEQRQKFHLQTAAGLVLVDWLSAGRSACGERWAFRRFHSRNEVVLGEERLLVDSLLLDPAEGPLAGSHRLGRFNCVALVLLAGPPVHKAAARLIADLAAQPVLRRARLVSSASPIREGALLRLAGESVEEVGREIARHLRFVHGLLGDDPWARKW